MPSKRYRRAGALIAFWDGQDFVFENYLTGKQTSISALVAHLLDALDELHSKDDLIRIFASIPCGGELIESLITADVLLEEGCPAETADRLLDVSWRWGRDARYFHFSTQRVAFQEPDQEKLSLAELAKADPPPAVNQSYHGPRTPLPQTFATYSGGLWDALRTRRTRRAFKRQPISLNSFAAVVQWCWGATQVIKDPVLGPYQLKTSPSGGARHPIEVYPVVIRVEEVESGIYHYSTTSHELTLLKAGGFEDLVVELCADQPWVRDASVVFFMTAVLERSMWKYRHSHAYRVIQLDAGHLGQTFHLVCTELGLAPFTTAALSAKRVEEELGLDGISEVAIYAAAAGPPA